MKKLGRDITTGRIRSVMEGKRSNKVFEVDISNQKMKVAVDGAVRRFMVERDLF